MLARSRWFPWLAAPLGLALFACGDRGPLEPREPPATPAAIALAVVSGNGQEGRVGAPLRDAFVVRVTDARGDGVGNAAVTWRLTSGAGHFQLSTPDILRTLTRADGVAAARFTPTAPGTSTVAAEVAGLQGSPLTFTTEAAPLDWPPVSGSALIYERVNGHSGPTLSFHGTLSERYVLEENGFFRLQFHSGRYRFFEYPGTYSRRDAALELAFDDDGRWRATGTFDGSDCLVVEYNIIMGLSDFEDGVYCPSAETQ